MALINISNLNFTYDGSYDPVFEDASFQIDSSWKLGLIGRNGRGKTTLLNLMLGKYNYDGRIDFAGMNAALFPFEIDNKERDTLDLFYSIYENLDLWELMCEMSHLELNDEILYRTYSTLSMGEQTKAMMALLFSMENRFLLIDEPTNHLDLEGRKTLSNYLKSKSGFILVSHDRGFIDGCVDHVMSINKAKIDIQKGNFSSWFENKTREDQFELAENEKIKKEIGRLSGAAKRNADWSQQIEKTKYATRDSGLRPDRGFIGHKAAKMMARSKSIENRKQLAIEEKSKLLKNIESAEDLKIHPLEYHRKQLMSMEKISISYEERTICKDVTFTVEEGDRIALRGKNGSGKSSIIKLILGEEINYAGDLYLGSRMKISYLPQDTSGLSGELKDFATNEKIDEPLFKAILRKLDFSRTQFEKRIESFSEGQKKKVLLAKSLCERANLYIWDEALNYVDVISRMQIESLLLSYQPTILFVEHDARFCENIATKIVEI